MNIDLQVPLTVDDDASKQEILDCARDLYIEYGLRRTTMEDVAKIIVERMKQVYK